MPETIKVVTPDHIELEYQLAGIGSRFSAVAIDHLIQIGVMIGIILIFQIVGFDGASGAFLAVMLVLIFLVFFCYFLFFEWLWSGQTPGKKSTGLRVLHEDGRPIDFTAAAIRNIVRIADFLPGTYGIGLVAMFISPRLQRVGDIASGTIVVIERPIHSTSIHKQSYSAPGGATGTPQVGFGIQKEDREAAIRFLARRSELDHHIRRDLAHKIATRIAERAQLPPAEATADPEAFLERVARSE